MSRTPDRRPESDGRSGAGGDERLADLKKRLAGASRRSAGPERSDQRGSQIGVAFRLATELVAGPAVGAFLGWYIDDWLSTSPLFLLVLFVLGAVAGGLNVIRAARQMQSASVSERSEPEGRGEE